MTDFDYEVSQKKRIARGSFARKNGCRSKRCTLPSDHLSPAELKRRNGPMKEYKMNAPMKWAEFNEMPRDLQVQYIAHMREKYNATDAMLGEMFGVHHSTVFNFRKAANLNTGAKMVRLSPEAQVTRDAAWAEFAGLEREHVKLDPLEEVSPIPELPAAVPEKPETHNTLQMSDLAVTFTGEFDAMKFMTWLSKLPMPTGNVKIRIEVTGE